MSQSPEGSSRHFSAHRGQTKGTRLCVSIARRLFSSFQLVILDYFDPFFKGSLNRPKALLVISALLLKELQESKKECLNRPKALLVISAEGLGLVSSISSHCLNRPKALLVISARRSEERLRWEVSGLNRPKALLVISAYDCGNGFLGRNDQSQSPEGSSRHFS